MWKKKPTNNFNYRRETDDHKDAISHKLLVTIAWF